MFKLRLTSDFKNDQLYIFTSNVNIKKESYAINFQFLKKLNSFE